MGPATAALSRLEARTSTRLQYRRAKQGGDMD